MKELRVPADCWEEDVDGILSTWLYQSGDQVVEGAVVAQVMVEKVQFDLAATAAGELRIEVEQESIIRKGDLVAHIIEAGE